LGVSSQTTVSDGAGLWLQSGISVGALPLSLAGRGVSNGGALRNVNGSNSWAGLVTLMTSTTQITSNFGVLTLVGASSISGSNIGLQIGGTGDVVVSGVISLGTTGTLIKEGTGRVTLGGENVYSGTTSVSAGFLRLSNRGGLGSSSVTTVSSGATLELIGGVGVSNVLRLNGNGSGLGVGALRNISGNNSWTGSITISTSTRISSDGDVLDVVGVMSGSGGVSYGGSGTVKLSEESIYTGVTEVLSGATLELGDNNVLSSSSDVVFSGGKLASAGKGLSVGTLGVSSASELVLGSGVHVVQFVGSGTFNFTRLVIRGWEGAYSGGSGTSGQVFVGNGV
jgi:autotransporter-associated beta strand protein